MWDDLHEHMLGTARQHGITIELRPVANARGCSGWYEHPRLVVCTGARQWRAIYVHEYAHLLQDIDERAGIDPGYAPISYAQYDAWATYTTQPGTRVRRALRRRIQQMEADADHRAWDLLQSHGLADEFPDYIQRAIAYHAYYTWISDVQRGGWYPRGRPPYDSAALVAACPTTWPTSYELDAPALAGYFGLLAGQQKK